MYTLLLAAGNAKATQKGAICTITDYGAVADNKTVNTASIQTAIDACHKASPQGSKVIVMRSRLDQSCSGRI